MEFSEKISSAIPNDEDVRLYEKRGWFVTPKILPDELLDEAYQGGMAFYNGERDFDVEDIIGPANSRLDGTEVLKNNEYVSLQKKEIKAIVEFPLISEIAARLSRTDEIRLFADALMCKFPAKADDNGVFGWHTDKAYWPSCTSNDMLTAWIPLQDVTIDMGPMHVIENSHHWEWDKELKQFCAAGNTDLGSFEAYLTKKGRAFKNIPLTLKKGQVSFHNGNVFHGSSTNVSTKNRMTLTIHMQDQKNAFKQAFNDKGEKIIIGYERMCRRDEHGNPDYRDPKFFPVLWSKD